MIFNTRRDFLKLSAASLMALAGGFHSSGVLAGQPYDRDAFTQGITGKGREYIAVGATPVELTHPENDSGYGSDIGSVLVFDVAAGESFEIPVPFFGHSISSNPVRPHQLAIFGRWGKTGALVDIRDRKVLAIVDPTDGNVFFGHSVFSADGAHLVTTEDNAETPKGVLVLRDASTLKIIQKMESYGPRPHECRSSDGGKTLIVTNGGLKTQEPNISWVDFESGKLINQVKLGSEGVAYTHCSMSADHWMCTVGSSVQKNPNYVAFVSPDGRVLRPDIPKDVLARMKHEAVSILFLEKSDLVVVTVPHSDLMMVLDYKKQKLIEVVNLAHPIGLLPTAPKNEADSSFLVSLVGGKMVSVTERAGKAATRVVDSRNKAYGGHLLRFYA